MLKLAGIVGPTASGKTEIAIQVAQKLNGEIISCDSMQIYQGMDIGTAKASKEDQSMVPHHLIDIVDIDVGYTVADYQRMAKKLIKDINEAGKMPVLVGGTGLYYQAVVDDYEFLPMESKKSVREKWNLLIKQNGLEYAYNRLQEVDREYSSLISHNDQKRIIRALEVYEITGKAFSNYQNRNKQTYKTAIVGIYWDRKELYRRIEERVDRMLENGLIDEVIKLREKINTRDNLNSMQALGYKQAAAYLDGFIDQETMVKEIKRETRRFAKRQYTWFNKDKHIFWINAGENSDKELSEKICSYIEGQLHTV